MLSHSRHSKFSYTRLTAVSLTLWCIAANSTSADTVLFFDDFSGPTLNATFQPSLPNGAPSANGDGSCTYLGAANYSFNTLDGATVLRVTNTLNNWQRRGWSTSTAFATTSFRYEARFNVLVQSPTTSIDSFIEAWLVDQTDSARYSIAAPSGENYGLNRQFRAGSRNGGQYTGSKLAYSYANNTWYRLVLQGQAGQNIRASLFADDNTTELIGRTLAYNASAFPNGFRIGLSQSTGQPNGAYPVDVAIDWVRLTTSDVPEPSTSALAALACMSFANTFLRFRRTVSIRTLSCAL